MSDLGIPNDTVIFEDGEDAEDIVAELLAQEKEWIRLGKPKIKYENEETGRLIQESVNRVVRDVLSKNAAV